MSPLDGISFPRMKAMIAATISRMRMTRHRFATLLGASVNQPRPTRSASRPLVENAETDFPNSR